MLDILQRVTLFSRGLTRDLSAAGDWANYYYVDRFRKSVANSYKSNTAYQYDTFNYIAVQVCTIRESNYSMWVIAL